MNRAPSTIDPVEVFALRAEARARLWAYGFLSFQQAFAPLIDQGVFEGIIEPVKTCPSCGCVPCIRPSFCKLAADADRAAYERRRWRSR